MKRCSLFLALALLAAIPAIARADSDTVLQGHVYRDGCLVPMAGARVLVTSELESRVASTDANGRFILFGLSPGVYAIRVELYGFDIGRAGNVTVDAGETDFVTVPMTSILDRNLTGYSVSDW